MICRIPQLRIGVVGDFRHEGAVVTGGRIYFGLQCKNPDPRHISLQTMRFDETMGRDEPTKTDDTVSIIHDTYEDRLTGFPRRATGS